MKIFTFLVFLLFIDKLAFPQVNRYDKPATATFKNTYVSPDFSLMMKMLNDKQAAYDQNRNYIDALINWIYELKSQTEEKQFKASMDSYYQKLRAFDGQDLSVLTNRIREVELGIKAEIDKYNTRVNEANNPSKYYDAGVENLKNEEFSSAIQNFNYVIQLSPNFPGSYFYRGFSNYSLGNFSSAISDLTRYIEMTGNDPNGYEYRGWSKYQQGDFTGAISDFNKQIELDPTSAIAYYNRGSAKSALKDEYGAINDYKKAIELVPTFSMAYNNLGWAKFNLKKYKEALVDVNMAIELDNNNSVAYDSRAEIKFNLNDYKGCIDDSDMALSINPNISNCYFLKGRSYYRLGNKEEACISWSKAGELGKTEAYDYISKYCNN